MDIQTILSPLGPISVSLHDETGQKEDISRYVEEVVQSDQTMQKWKVEDKQLVIRTVSNKADGM